MIQFVNILFLTFSSLTAYLLSISPISNFVPQIIALSSIILIVISLRHRQFSLHLIAFIINLIVFHTQGLNSPFFFLIYFLLFTLAFQNPPTTTLSYSLVLILLLAQSLNSRSSLIPIISLLFITPLSWFIGKQYLDKTKTDTDLSVSETDILLWLSLKFKTGICQIIDTTSEVLSTPLTPTQKDHLKYIKDSAKSLLNSSQKLKDSVDRQSDET